MYTSIRRYKVKKDSMDELIRRIKAEFVPKISKLPGFQQYYVIKVSPGEIATISAFTDQEAVKKSDNVASEWIKQDLAGFIPPSFEIIQGEAVVQKLKG